MGLCLQCSCVVCVLHVYLHARMLYVFYALYVLYVFYVLYVLYVLYAFNAL